MRISSDRITLLQEEVLTWYAVHQRILPWRQLPFDPERKQRDPYRILVSEIMSQQTQISRVVPKYLAWIERFPTLQALAHAETSEVLRYWSGLGYNRRAINLQNATKGVVTDFQGIFPRTIPELKKLPGIGEYTASAIACFAFNQQIAVVDTNVRRVIITQLLRKHEAGRYDDQSITEKEIQTIAEQLVPDGRAYEWNQALMDYATAKLKKEKIVIPKQSKFLGSNRYYRGQIIKLLLEYKVVSITFLAERWDKDETFVERIVTTLEKEGMVTVKGDAITLA